MDFLTPNELKRMLLFSYERVEREKEQINKINVFPVPDQDTGSNLAKTLEGVKDAISSKDFKNLKEFSDAALEGALNTAQGNAGVIYTGFLAGFLPALGDNEKADSSKIASALAKGAERARQSIQHPHDGTILDVIEASALAFEQEKRRNDIVDILKAAVEKANSALLATRDKMEVFRKANVVDAGGMGFLIILESYLEALEGEKRKMVKIEARTSEKTKRFIHLLSNRFEIVALIENPRFGEEEFKEKLKNLGESLDIVKIGNRIKLHIHTDYPDDVKDFIRKSGDIQTLREEDMANEVVGEDSVRNVSVGIVTDESAMLLPKIIEKYRMETIGFKYEWPGKKPEETIYQKMRSSGNQEPETFPKISPVFPHPYLDAFNKQLAVFNQVLCITPSSKISGCYEAALQAREMSGQAQKIYVLDSLNACSGQALLVLRAVELIQEHREIGEIIQELKKNVSKIRFLGVAPDPRWGENAGRIARSQVRWIRKLKKLKLQPVMKIKNGQIVKGGLIFAADPAEALVKKIIKESKKARKKGKKIRVIIGHADNLNQANKLKKTIKENVPAEVSFINITSDTVAAGSGPDAVFCAWMPLRVFNEANK